jgi:hypothetical protein
VFDLDDHDGSLGWEGILDAARRLAQGLIGRGLAFVAFRSGGGAGIHLFVPFSTPVPARELRRVMQDVVTSVGFAEGDGGVAKNQIEVFPKQDQVPVDGYGNLVALPLARKSTLLDERFDAECRAPLDVLDTFTPNSPERIRALFTQLGLENRGKERRAHCDSAEEGTSVNPLSACLFIQHCNEEAARLSEPLWYAAACNLAQTDGGDAYFHELSARDPSRYDPKDTQKKLEHARESAAPHSCQKIGELGFRCPKMDADGRCSVTGGTSPLSFAGSLKQKIARLRGSRPAHVRNRAIAKLVIDELCRAGVFYYAIDDHSLYYFYNPEKRLYRIESTAFRAACCDMFGLNAAEQEFKFVFAEIEVHATRHGTAADFVRFARYERGMLYVNAGGNRVFRLNGETIDVVDNGVDGVLFRNPDEVERVELAEVKGSPVREHLLGALNTNDQEFRDLYHVYVYALFFESLLPTKPIVLITGEKGSGKSFAGRSLKRALFGQAQDVDTGLTSDEKNAKAAIINNYVVCMDNVDGMVPWLANLLASVSTGTLLKERKLYENSVELSYRPRCFLMLNSRDPASLRRDDIVDRLLIFEVQRHEVFTPEGRLLEAISTNRPAVWRELLQNLNRIVRALRDGLHAGHGAHRLADFANLATVIAKLIDAEGAINALARLDEKRNDLLLENDPLVHALETWVKSQPEPRWITTGELFKAIGFAIPYKNARAFGMHLQNMRTNLSALFDIQFRRGRANTKEVRLALRAQPEGG